MDILERAQRDPTFLRAKRRRLFKAFDVLKENVNFGIDTLTQERKQEILDWYQDALDLEYEAITNYPSELEKYLKNSQ